MPCGSGGANAAPFEDRLRRPLAAFDATLHEALVVVSAMLAGEMQVAHGFADGASQRRPLAGAEAGIAAQAPRMAGPMEARLAHAGTRRSDAGKDRLQLAARRIRLLPRRTLTDVETVLAADEVGQDARLPGLHAAGFPGRLQ